MRAFACDREAESLAAVQAGRWPETCDPDLCAHVDGCAICSDVILVASAFEGSGNLVLAGAGALPPAALVWWKAQLRARREAVELASQPVALFEPVAYALGCLALIALAIWQRARLESWVAGFGKLADMARDINLDLRDFVAAGASLAPWMTGWVSILTVAVFALLITSAICMAVTED